VVRKEGRQEGHRKQGRREGKKSRREKEGRRYGVAVHFFFTYFYTDSCITKGLFHLQFSREG
jgi:hypothetical protein